MLFRPGFPLHVRPTCPPEEMLILSHMTSQAPRRGPASEYVSSCSVCAPSSAGTYCRCCGCCQYGAQTPRKHRGIAPPFASCVLDQESGRALRREPGDHNDCLGTLSMVLASGFRSATDPMPNEQVTLVGELAGPDEFGAGDVDLGHGVLPLNRQRQGPPGAHSRSNWRRLYSASITG